MINEINANSLFDTNDVRKLVFQLSDNKPKIILNVEDRYFGAFQLKDDLKEEEFERIDSKYYEYFDPNKPTYTGTTIFREYECLVSKESLIRYLNEFIESEEFIEGEKDLNSFLSWGFNKYGLSFEQDLDSWDSYFSLSLNDKK